MRSLLLALALVLSCGVATIGQRGATAKPDSSPPRLPDGQYDLEGVWDFSTITPLERPSSLADKQTLTDEEALTFEREENQRQNRDLIDPKKGGAQYLPGSVIPYNEFWFERGNKIVGSNGLRSSSIRRTAASRRSRRRHRRRLDALAAAARDEQLGTVSADSCGRPLAGRSLHPRVECRPADDSRRLQQPRPDSPGRRDTLR